MKNGSFTSAPNIKSVRFELQVFWRYFLKKKKALRKLTIEIKQVTLRRDAFGALPSEQLSHACLGNERLASLFQSFFTL